MKCTFNSVGTRISEAGGANPHFFGGGDNLVTKNCVKMETFWRARVPGTPLDQEALVSGTPLDPSMV